MCGKTKSVTEFYSDLRNKDGYSYCCKSCYSKKGKSYHKKLAARSPKEIPKVKNKRCSKCGKNKPASDFFKSISKADGYSSICKECSKNYVVKHRKKVSDREFNDIELKGEKRCWMCGKLLPIEEYNYDRGNPDGFSNYCRECGKKYKQKHYAENYGDAYNRSKEYRQNYPERYKAYAIVYEATKRGELIRPDKCSKCGKPGYIVAYHDGYDRPLDVVWLCLSCNRQIHADLKRKQ
jgi:hypothetical protein